MGTYSEIDIQRKSMQKSKNSHVKKTSTASKKSPTKSKKSPTKSKKSPTKSKKSTRSGLIKRNQGLNDYGVDWRKEFRLKEKYLKENYERVDPIAFYQDLFSRKPINKSWKTDKDVPNGLYTPIMLHAYHKPYQIDIDKWASEEEIEHRMVLDGFDEIKKAIGYQFKGYIDENWVAHGGFTCKPKKGDEYYLAPITYAGRRRTCTNKDGKRVSSARFLYSLTLDIDYITESDMVGILLLFKHDRYLTPTYIVNTGKGIHLYYVLTEPLPMYGNYLDPIKRLKELLTVPLWETRSKKEKIDSQGAVQMYRVVGSATKFGTETTCYRVGEPIDLTNIDRYLDIAKANCASIKFELEEIMKVPKYTKEECKTLFPEWYKWKFEGGEQPKRRNGTIMRGKNVHRLYETLKERVLKRVKTGHRFLSMAAIFADAAALGIGAEDAYNFAIDNLEWFNNCDKEAKSNPFTVADIESAMSFYDEDFGKCLTLETLEKMTGYEFTDIRCRRRPKGQRLKQAQHVKVMNSIRTAKEEMGITRITRFGAEEGNKSGRHSAEQTVREYLTKHPRANKAKVIRETGLDKKTVYKWYNAIKQGVSDSKSAM